MPEEATRTTAEPKAPHIYSLTVARFRSIRSLSWNPSRRVNVILGGGDVGKTTLLEAIGLLLNPTNAALSDTDYHLRNVEAGFEIEAVLSLPDTSDISRQLRPAWPWHWNGSEPIVPRLDDEESPTGEPVYRVRVRGTEELDLIHEIVQPDQSTDPFTQALRRSIGLVRLSSDDRNDRDLRLVQGSALDRLLSDKALRSRLINELAKANVTEQFTEASKAVIGELDAAFRARNLPSDIGVAVTGAQGYSVAALIGLTAMQVNTRLPLTSWGAGTRRLAALTIAEHRQADIPITLVDEVERGLEPYRQAFLIERLEASGSQVFVSTHSPAVIAAAGHSAFWHVDFAGQIGRIDSESTQRLRRTDPVALLARVAIVAEGKTEVGFVTALLERAFESGLDRYGVHVTDGGGHESTLSILEALSIAGLRFGGFADDEEGKHPARWKRVSDRLGNLLFRWESGCIEENVIRLIEEDRLPHLIDDPQGDRTGMRLRTLADRLGIQDKTFEAIKSTAAGRLKERILEACQGTVPPGCEADKGSYKSHAGTWFKSLPGGRELAEKMFSLGLWPLVADRLLPFCNAVRAAVGLPEKATLEP